jgi:GDP-4-dehydro-6-deoxy-D-mannose reductase
MKTLVTGADGFIGGTLARLLVERGDEVVGLSRRATDAPAVTFERAHADLRDAVAVRAAFERVKPERVFHLAALNHIPTSFKEPEETFAVNALGTLHVLDAARAVVPEATFVSVGSSSEYGDAARERPFVGEDDPLLPTSPYAISKVTQALLCRQVFKTYGQKAIHVRPFAVIGPGKKGDALTQFCERVVGIEKGGATALRCGNLEPFRDFIDVRDCASALVLVAEKAPGGSVVNVCNGVAVKMAELVETLRSVAGRPFEIVIDPAQLRPVDDMRIVGDPKRLRALGYVPAFSLADTVRDTLSRVRGNPS